MAPSIQAQLAPHVASEAQALAQAQAAQPDLFFHGYVILKDPQGPCRRSLGGAGPGLDPAGSNAAAAADASGADAGTKAHREKLKGAYVKTAPLNLGALGLQEQHHHQQQQQQPPPGYTFLTLPDRRIYFTPDQPGQVRYQFAVQVVVNYRNSGRALHPWHTCGLGTRAQGTTPQRPAAPHDRPAFQYHTGR